MQTSGVVVVVLTTLIGPGLAAQQAPVRPQRPSASFRSAIALVPVDVRVIDGQGRPITDLRREDFTILEEGVQQDIRHFALQVLSPEPPSPPGAPSSIRKAANPQDGASGLAAQRNRVFLLVLGRGRLQYPSKALDALLHFVRVQLLPQDRVAVLAYDRATDFTTDHGQIWQLIQRLRASHERIEALLAQQFGGLAAVYGSKAMPRALQAEITNLFKGSGGLASRQFVPSEIADARGVAETARRATDGAMQATIPKPDPEFGESLFLSDLRTAEDQALTDLPFEEFVARNAGTMQDLSKIYTGISYMRFLEGEKHLAFFTEQGLDILRGDDVTRLAEAANDARVVIDNFQTGGVSTGGVSVTGRGTTFGFGAPLALKDLRTLSTSTGGQASIMEYTSKGLDRVDLSTRASYLLGYYPAKPLGDGGYRNLVVKVRRPGVTVLYRHGYFARLEPPAFDRRAFLTSNRVVSAALYRSDVRDIRVQVNVTRVPGEGGAADELVVEGRIDAAHIGFTAVDGKQVGTLTVAAFFADAKRVLLHERSQTLDLKLPAAAYQTVQRDGIPYALRMAIKDSVRFVKVVVYNYERDAVGSAEIAVK